MELLNCPEGMPLALNCLVKVIEHRSDSEDTETEGSPYPCSVLKQGSHHLKLPSLTLLIGSSVRPFVCYSGAFQAGEALRRTLKTSCTFEPSRLCG